MIWLGVWAHRCWEDDGLRLYEELFDEAIDCGFLLKMYGKHWDTLNIGSIIMTIWKTEMAAPDHVVWFVDGKWTHEEYRNDICDKVKENQGKSNENCVDWI